MGKRVFITGIGIISAIGDNIKQTIFSLLNSKSGIGDIEFLETSYRGLFPVGEVKHSDKELASMLNLKTPRNHTRTTLLGMLAVSEAIENSGIEFNNGKRIGLLSATSVGGMNRSEKFYKAFVKNQQKGRLVDIIHHECSDSTEMIADFFGIKHFITTISTACSSSVNSLMMASRLIKNDILDIAIAGGTDSLTAFTINGFNSLMILDKNKCRPFDESRSGLNLGEGAGFLVLESEEMLMKSGKKPLAEILGYANACDAYHQTASSPEGNGAYLAMKGALDVSGLSSMEIDYINVHGTGTQNNDLSEGKAIHRLFGNNIPPFSSTKGFTGHTLGAAGGIEAVISVLSIQQNALFPNLNFSIPIAELRFSPITEICKNIEIKNIMSNSFGFGGNNSSIIISK